MRLFRAFVVAAAVGAFVPAAANAADLLTVPVSTAASVPVSDGFDWNGFYAGIYGVGQLSPLGGPQLGAGLDLGVNAQFDYVLVGGEVAFHGLTGGASGTYIEALGKVGVLPGDDVLLYATAGYGLSLGPAAETDLLLGGGVEFAVTDNVTLRTQYLHGFPLTGGNPKDQVTAGVNFHF